MTATDRIKATCFISNVYLFLTVLNDCSIRTDSTLTYQSNCLVVKFIWVRIDWRIFVRTAVWMIACVQWRRREGIFRWKCCEWVKKWIQWKFFKDLVLLLVLERLWKLRIWHFLPRYFDFSSVLIHSKGLIFRWTSFHWFLVCFQWTLCVNDEFQQQIARPN